MEQIFRVLYGVEHPQGCTEAEIAPVRERFGVLPARVEEFWRTFGRTPRLNYVQDTWILPEHYQKWTWPAQEDHLLLLHENQGVCRAGIRREDLTLPDPPVYTRMEDDDPWLLSAPTTSEFLEAALTYEAVWQLEHVSQAFYELSRADMETVQARLTRRPAVFRNWMEMDITFYSSLPDNLAVILDMGDGAYQTIYGGATEESYHALLEVMEGLGEAI